MKSAILNSALPFIAQQANSGFWLSITHFSLAYASNDERDENPIGPQMTEMVRQNPPDGVVKGDYIYNIWQTPFADGQYAGSFFELTSNPSKYFQYEYNNCDQKNVLKGNQTIESAAGWDDAYTHGFGFGFAYDGYSDTDKLTSKLTSANIPYALRYDIQANRDAGVTQFSELFPIKSYTHIDRSSEGEMLVNYNLSLPALTTSLKNLIYEKAIGNFKFNRVGLYMTVCAKTEVTVNGKLKSQYTPYVDKKPILFAVIDIGVDGCSSNDVKFDVYKTRDDSGFAGWDFDAQLPIKNVSNSAQTDVAFYHDTMRDSATVHYQAQIVNNASIVETVMQLQMMVLQLATAFQQITGINPYSSTKIAGYDVDSILEIDNEYEISTGGSTSRMLLDAMAFRGISDASTAYINTSNAMFSLVSSPDIEDGEIIKVTLYNLDGTYYTSNGVVQPWWNGSIVFVDYNASTSKKTKLYELDFNKIKGFSYAKVTILCSYSKASGRWIVESVSTIDETDTVK